MKVFESKFTERQLKSVNDIIKRGEIGFGPNVSIFEKTFKNKQTNKHQHYIATNSASSAAFMIFAYLKEQYGACDVYTPSLGFASPVWAAQHFGHNIIWVDVDCNLLFDVDDYKEKRKWRCERYSDGGIKPVLMPILYGGVSQIKDWDTLKDDGYNEIKVIDSAHGITPSLDNDFVFFSFHPFKPIASSDGGMIGTSNDEANEYFLAYRNFGRSNINGTYDVTQQGFKFYMNNLNATLALESLSEYENDLDQRISQYELWKELLNEHDCPGYLVPHSVYSSYYFATWISDKITNDICKETGLSKHYPLLHQTKFYEEADYDWELGTSERLHDHIINLPLYTTTLGQKMKVLKLL